MFRAHVLIVTRPKLYYTVSGIITSIGVLYSLWYHHIYRCTIQSLVSSHL